MTFNLDESQFNKLKSDFDLILLIKTTKSNLNPVEIYENIRNKNSILLHSPNKEKNSRYSIIATDPNQFIEITDQKEPFNIFKSLLNKKTPNNLIFNGGLIGFFSYDMVHYIENLPKTTNDDLNIPKACLGLYNNFIIHDNNKENEIKIVSVSNNFNNSKNNIEKLEKKLIKTKSTQQLYNNNKLNIENNKIINNLNIVNNNTENKLNNNQSTNNSLKINKNIKNNLKIKENNENSIFIEKNNSLQNPLTSNFKKQEYLDTIKKVKNYILEGDTYQVNISQRFETKTNKTPLELYKNLIKINPSPFSALIEYSNFALISSSPERLVKHCNNIIETRPIAGTRKLTKDKNQNTQLENELKTNKKELAEHTMLVDLERNDLGKVSEYGSVIVNEKFIVEKYSHVMHLVSNIIGKKQPNIGPFQIFKAIFPGGTITGCPKIRTMEIIDELEPTNRGPYTGSIGYIDYNDNMDLNIIIRTILKKDNKAYLQVGGGIVQDSTQNFEFDETINKSKALFEALEK